MGLWLLIQTRTCGVRLSLWKPTAQPPPHPVSPCLRLSSSSRTAGPLHPGIYKSSSDVVAVQWLPAFMTYLCVHQPQGDIRKRAGQLLDILTLIGLVFVVISASGTWIFVGWLVERYESNLAVPEERNRTLVQNSDAIVVIDDTGMILHTNPSAESLFGVTKESARIRPVSDFWQSDALATPQDRIHPLSVSLRSGPRTGEQLQFPSEPAGSIFWEPMQHTSCFEIRRRPGEPERKSPRPTGDSKSWTG